MFEQIANSSKQIIKKVWPLWPVVWNTHSGEKKPPTNMDNFKQFSHWISQYWNTILFINVVPFFYSSEQSSWCLWSGIVSAFISPCLISYITFDFFCILLYFLRLSVVFWFKDFLNYILMNVSSFWIIFLLSFQSRYEVIQFLHHSPRPFRVFFITTL